jgi:fructose-1,6-bisphosphatase/inositol monophosphatase family enzyme
MILTHGHSIGEESHAAGERQELTDEFTWIVDPIDVSSGTDFQTRGELTSL